MNRYALGNLGEYFEYYFQCPSCRKYILNRRRKYIHHVFSCPIVIRLPPLRHLENNKTLKDVYDEHDAFLKKIN